MDQDSNVEVIDHNQDLLPNLDEDREVCNLVDLLDLKEVVGLDHFGEQGRVENEAEDVQGIIGEAMRERWVGKGALFWPLIIVNQEGDLQQRSVSVDSEATGEETFEVVNRLLFSDNPRLIEGLDF